MQSLPAGRCRAQARIIFAETKRTDQGKPPWPVLLSARRPAPPRPAAVSYTHLEIQLLSEGHEAIAARLPDPEAQEALEERVSVVEAVVRFQGEQIQELKKAQ